MPTGVFEFSDFFLQNLLFVLIWSKGASVQKEGTNRGAGKYFEFKTSLTTQSTNFLKIIFSVAGILNHQGISRELKQNF